MRLFPFRSREGWYEPQRRSLASLRRCRQQLTDTADDEVGGMAAASAWLRYSAKHCPDTPYARSALHQARDFMADLAAALDRIEGTGDYDE